MILNSFYNPYLNLPYYSPSSYDQYGGGSSGYQDLESRRLHRQRAEALAAQRARRARYLPTEDVDSDEDDLFGPLRSRERAHLDARRQETFGNERRHREAEAQAYQQRLEELRRQEATRLRQAAELERNRREQARRPQQPFGRDPTVPNHDGPPHKRSSSQASQEEARYASPHEGPSQGNAADQQATKAGGSTPDAPSPLATKYTQTHHDAAQRIQQLYRQQRSLRSVNDIASQFEETRSSFSLPEAVDFANSTLSSVDENVVTVNTALPASDTAASAPSDPDDDWDVVVEASGDGQGANPSQTDITLDGQIIEGGSPDDISQPSEVATPSEGGQSDFKAPDEEPWVTIDPQQSETLSESATNGQVDVDTNAESLSTPPTTQTAETVVDDQDKMAVDDVSLNDNTARLAYTKQNYPIHAYMEKLNVLLMKLDGVESHGSKQVRERRKQAAKSIEMEAERIEKLVKDIWRTHTQKCGDSA